MREQLKELKKELEEEKELNKKLSCYLEEAVRIFEWYDDSKWFEYSNDCGRRAHETLENLTEKRECMNCGCVYHAYVTEELMCSNCGSRIFAYELDKEGRRIDDE